MLIAMHSTTWTLAGANEHSILVATAKDHLHSCKLGIMLHLSEVAYSGLTNSEWTEFEEIVRTMVQGCTSSVLAEYPCSTVKADFGKLTLCSHKEKVGSVFYLLIALHNKQGCELFEKAHEWQKKKYNTIPTRMAVASMKMAVQKKSSTDEAPCAKTEDHNETDSDSHTEVEIDEDDITDSDWDSKLDNTANKLTSKELPASAFLYQKDMLYWSDHQKRHPFDCINESIEFVCQELHHHSFSFLMDNAELGTYQLDLLMIVSWEILCTLK